MHFKRQQLIMKLDMEKKHVKHCHNFYVDALLKSVETEELAVRLIRDVKAMCQAGGFNVAKFMSNKKVVIQSVPEYDRRNGIKNADLDTSLPLEKALGVYWDIENDISDLKFC